MTRLDSILFNLFFNSISSFVVGILVVELFVFLFKMGATRWKLAVISLPFLKILVDFLRGIPRHSFLLTGVDPWSLPPKHNLLSIGAGFSYYGPVLTLALGVTDTKGTEHSISVADFVGAWLSRHVFASFPRVLLTVFLFVSLLLMVRRLAAYLSFEICRRKELREGMQLIPISTAAVFLFRKPYAYISDYFKGTPFTGGILKPYVCFPRDAYDLLAPDERMAVLQHEVAHIQSWDCLATVIIKLLGDLFWFVPGYRYLSHKIDRLKEILADRDAVQLGASAESLASALVRLKEVILGAPHLVLYSALIRNRPLLKERVDYLLAPTELTTGERLGWNRKLWRPVLAFWIFGAVMVATFGGNHEMETRPVSSWLNGLFGSSSS